jgi:hypothetical protein
VFKCHCKFWISKHLSNIIPIHNGLKQGNPLFLLLFNSDLEHGIRKASANPQVLKLNGTHKLRVYTYNVNLSGTNINTMKENHTISQQKSLDFVIGITIDLNLITAILCGHCRFLLWVLSPNICSIRLQIC